MSETKKIRVGVVGLGHRGRWMTRLVSMFDFAELVAACDILPRNWHTLCWLEEMPLVERFPNATFYESYDEMLEKVKKEVSKLSDEADKKYDTYNKKLQAKYNNYWNRSWYWY